MEVSTTVESSFSDFSWSALWVEAQLRGRLNNLPNPIAITDEAIQMAVNIAFELTINKDVKLIRFKVAEIAFFELKLAHVGELSPTENTLMLKYMEIIENSPNLIDTDGDGVPDTSVLKNYIVKDRVKKF